MAFAVNLFLFMFLQNSLIAEEYQLNHHATSLVLEVISLISKQHFAN